MKKKKQWTISKEIHISIFAILIVVAAILTVYYFNVNQTQFTITKEVCEERQLMIGYEILEVEEIRCHQSIVFKNECNDPVERCYSEEDKEKYPCTGSCVFDNFFDLNPDSRVVRCIYYEVDVIEKEFIQKEERTKDIYKTETLCHEEEVGVLYEEFDCKDKLGMGMVNWEGDRCFILKNKEDLTISWLNENAECIIVHGKKISEDTVRGYCSEYKLGNYTIEVE